MTSLERAFLRMARKSDDEIYRIADSGHGLEKLCAKAIIIMATCDDALNEDFAGQKREKNGQFGKGKMARNSESGIKKKPLHHTEQEIRKYLGGKPKVNRAETKKHVYGSPEFEEAVKERKKSRRKPSILFHA